MRSPYSTKYAVTFLLLGLCVSGFAASLEGWWHLLHWFSLSCVLLALGYAGVGPCIFGKRTDGRIPLWSKLVHLPFLLYSHCIWHLVRAVSRENPMDEASSDLVLGRRQCGSENPPSGISNYVDLTAEMEDPKAARDSGAYVCLPILDADVPDGQALRRVVAALRPGRTFVHCAQGHGRTGLFALAFLAARGQIRSYDEGIERLTTVRPRLRLNRWQEIFMRNYIAEQVHADMPSRDVPSPSSGKSDA